MLPGPTFASTNPPGGMSEQSDLSRLEFFSDGVMAIAATLLVLELKVPRMDEVHTAHEAWAALGKLWPSYLAFALSFGMILVIWVNHHFTLRLLGGLSKHFLYANGLLLFTITLLPFPTGVLAEYINTPYASVGVALYGLSSLFINLAWVVWWRAMERPLRLFRAEVEQTHIAGVKRNIHLGLALYACSTLMAFLWPTVGILFIMGINIMWVTISLAEKRSLPGQAAQGKA